MLPFVIALRGLYDHYTMHALGITSTPTVFCATRPHGDPPFDPPLHRVGGAGCSRWRSRHCAVGPASKTVFEHAPWRTPECRQDLLVDG